MNNYKNQTMGTFKIGTRGSDLALWQAREVASKLEAATELVIIKTSGDRFQDIPLQGQSQVGFFTREIETRLMENQIDIAVHSLKDLPTQLHPDLLLGAFLPRAAVSDLLLVHPDWLDESAVLPVKPGCTIGATSLRRQALVRLYAPGAKPEMLRGNVPTRVQKCRDGQYGAIVLARAGVQRLALDISPLLAYELNPEIWLPAPGQGVVAVQIRRNHTDLLEIVKKLDDPTARDAAAIERKLLANFEGGCHTAFGAYARCSKPGDNQWNTLLGMEQTGKGWGQTGLRPMPFQEVTQITAADINDFQPLPVNKQEELCQPIQW